MPQRARRRRSRSAAELQPSRASSTRSSWTSALGVPSNLVLRGNDIRPANAPIEIGDMNVTVGGAVQVQQGAGRDVRAARRGQHRPRQLHVPGPPLRDPARRPHPLRRQRRARPARSTCARGAIISGVETFVRVQGTMRQPELSFSSNPPLDQADILSLIVFNQPINELGEGQQVSLARARRRAGRRLSGVGPGALDRQRARARRVRDPGAGRERARPEPDGRRAGRREAVLPRPPGLRRRAGDRADPRVPDRRLPARCRRPAAETAGGTQRVTFRRIERGGLDLIFFFSY